MPDAVDAAFGRLIGVQVLGAVPTTGFDTSLVPERDDDVDAAKHLTLNGFRILGVDVDADFRRRLGGQRVDGSSRRGAGRYTRAVAPALVHQPGDHLGLAAVHDEDEQHRGRGAGHHMAGAMPSSSIKPRTQCSKSSRIWWTAGINLVVAEGKGLSPGRHELASRCRLPPR